MDRVSLGRVSYSLFLFKLVAYNSASGGLIWMVESEAPDPPGSIFHVAEQGVLWRRAGSESL